MIYQSFYIVVAGLDDAQPPQFEQYRLVIDEETLEVDLQIDSADASEDAQRFAHSLQRECRDLDELEIAYAEVFGQIEARGNMVGGAGFAEEPLDLSAAIASAKKARMSRRKAAALERDSRWPELSDKLAELFDNADLTGDALAEVQQSYDLDISPSALLDSLEFVVAIDPADRSEGTVSKWGGSPDLPDSLDWPPGDDVEFVAQFCLDELRPFDVYEILPQHGVLYVFISEGGTSLEILYSEQVSEPGEDDEATSLRFRPSFYFEQSTDTYASTALVDALPETLLASIKDVLGMTADSPAVSKDSDRFFGEEMDWQAMGWLLDEPLLMHLIHRDVSLNIGIAYDDLILGDFSSVEYAPSGT